MTTFDDKEKAAENKYAYDREREFKVMARRTKLLGLWAAARMNMEGADADHYAKLLVAHDLETPGDDDVIAKVKADFSAKAIEISEHDIRAELHRVGQVAKEQISKE